MKKFRFPLERLLNYRRGRLAAEQARLERLVAEQAALERRRAALEHEERFVMESLRRLPVITASDLNAAEGFRRFAAAECVRLLSEAGMLASRIEAQKNAVLSARREVEILERLREKRLHDWRSEVDKDMEQQVAELVVARWRRPAGSG
jgi:flagellar export protein FliJ